MPLATKWFQANVFAVQTNPFFPANISRQTFCLLTSLVVSENHPGVNGKAGPTVEQVINLSLRSSEDRWFLSFDVFLSTFLFPLNVGHVISLSLFLSLSLSLAFWCLSRQTPKILTIPKDIHIYIYIYIYLLTNYLPGKKKKKKPARNKR